MYRQQHNIRWFCLEIIRFRREPIPDCAAKAFLKDFLAEFSDGSSFYASVRQARRNLEDSFNKEYPGIAWLPIICQNLSGKQPSWDELRKPVQTPARTGIGNKTRLKRLAVAGMFLITGFICILIIKYNIPVTWKAKYYFGQIPGILNQDKNNLWTESLSNMEFVRIPGDVIKWDAAGRTIIALIVKHRCTRFAWMNSGLENMKLPRSNGE